MFSSAPRCQRIRCRQSARHVGISSVTTRHCIGETIFAPSVFKASVISLSSVIANVSYTLTRIAGDELAAGLGDRLEGVGAEQRRRAGQDEDLPRGDGRCSAGSG